MNQPNQSREERLISDLRKKNALLREIFSAVMADKTLDAAFLVSATHERDIDMSSFLHETDWFDYTAEQIITQYAKGELSEGGAAQMLNIDRLEVRGLAQTQHPEEFLAGAELDKYLVYREREKLAGRKPLPATDWLSEGRAESDPE